MAAGLLAALKSLLSDPAVLVGLGLIAAGTAYYMANRLAPMKPPLPLDNQSLEMPVSFLPQYMLQSCECTCT